LDRALRAYESSFRAWNKLAEDHPHPDHQDLLFHAACRISRILIRTGHPEGEVLRRFEDLRCRPVLLADGRDLGLLFDLPRAEDALHRADGHFRAKEQAAGLAEARNASRILEGCFPHAPLSGSCRFPAVNVAFLVGKALRDGREPAEALRLLERVNGRLQELAREAPKGRAPGVLALLSESWDHLGRAHWELGQEEETVCALGRALEVQRQACALAPAADESRRVLGVRYRALGRKLCELGRLDEAEACFRQRQALWPEDAAWREEALRELQKWADGVGDGKTPLSPEQRQERQRYLELRDRLAGKAGGAAAATGNAKP
jgi:tetratricopeptide (TPR) repeat protein